MYVETEKGGRALFVPVEVAQSWLDAGGIRSDGRSIYRWRETHWQKVPDEDLLAEAMAELEKLFDHRDFDICMVTMSHAKQSVEAAKLYLLNEVPMHDRTPDLIVPCANGYLNLETHELQFADPDLYLQHAVECDFERGAECPKFEEYLTDALPSEPVRERVQEFLGTLLIADDFQLHQLWLGPGAVPLGKIIRALHGEAAISTTEALQQTRSSTLAVEAEGYRAGSAKAGISKAMKDAWSNKRKAVNAKYQAPSYMSVNGKQVQLGSMIPIVSDPSSHWRYWDAVAFQPAMDVSAEVIADELPGVLRWCLNGLMAVLERGGFDRRPEGVRPIITAAKNDTSSLLGWIEGSNARVVTGASMTKEAIYASYCNWCKSEGLQPLGVVTFWTRARQVLPGLVISKQRINGAEARVANVKMGSAPNVAYARKIA